MLEIVWITPRLRAFVLCNSSMPRLLRGRGEMITDATRIPAASDRPGSAKRRLRETPRSGRRQCRNSTQSCGYHTATGLPWRVARPVWKIVASRAELHHHSRHRAPRRGTAPGMKQFLPRPAASTRRAGLTLAPKHERAIESPTSLRQLASSPYPCFFLSDRALFQTVEVDSISSVSTAHSATIILFHAWVMSSVNEQRDMHDGSPRGW